VSDIYKAGMTHERFSLLSDPKFTGSLTEEEMAAGWHFCNTGWDGMLVHITEEEMEFCMCNIAVDEDKKTSHE
jgi:hypothetical protein